MLRFILIILFLTIFFIISLPLFAIEWLIGKFNPHAKDISSLRIVQAAFKVVLFIAGVKTTVIGFENIPKDEPVLFVGNHRGFFDVVISYSMMPNLTGFISKNEIKKVPILRTWMLYLHCLFLDRNNIKEGLKTILSGIEDVKNGISIVIFPEGTRNDEDGIKRFKQGSFKIAEKSGCKIIPMVQNNTSAVFEDHFPRVKRTHTVIEFGTPIDISTLEEEQRKAIGAYTHDIMLEMYEKNKALV
ncbi:MAG: lysophospholipid acyltransferase family protein [Bacteroides sp.]